MGEGRRLPALATRLGDLRRRLKHAFLAFGVAFVVANLFAQEVFVLCARPLLEAWAKRKAEGNLGDPTLYFASLMDPFMVYLGQSAWVALFLASPFFLYQVWKAVAFGRITRTQTFVALAVASSLLFIAGAAFCYVVVMPTAFDFLLGYAAPKLGSASEGGGQALALRPMLLMTEYLDLARRLMLAFGLVFDLPIFVYVLARLGMVTPSVLWRFNRFAIPIAFALAAVLTPGPDVISQLFMAVPLVVLYNASIIIAAVVARGRRTTEEAPVTTPGPRNEDAG